MQFQGNELKLLPLHLPRRWMAKVESLARLTCSRANMAISPLHLQMQLKKLKNFSLVLRISVLGILIRQLAGKIVEKELKNTEGGKKRK